MRSQKKLKNSALLLIFALSVVTLSSCNRKYGCPTWSIKKATEITVKQLPKLIVKQ